MRGEKKEKKQKEKKAGRACMLPPLETGDTVKLGTHHVCECLSSDPDCY